MKKNRQIESFSSEFIMYESIVYGELRPFLPKYSSSEYIKIQEKLRRENLESQDAKVVPGKKKKADSKLAPNSKELINQCQAVYQIDFGDELSKVLKVTGGTKIPPPPDLKAKFFLSLIQDEFDQIRERAEKFIQKDQGKMINSRFADQNIQKARKLAIDSGYLSKLLEPNNSNPADDSDSYIIYVLGLFLVRSILLYQDLFEPYIEKPLETEDELHACISNPYVFSLKGDYWKINFRGKEIILKNLERIRYVVHLLENPNQEFYCRDLTALVKGLNPETNQYYGKMGEEQLEKDNLSLTDLQIEMLSPEEKENLENMAYDIWEKTKNASLGKHQKDAAINEWERVKSHLLNEYGIMVFSSDKGLSFKIKLRLKKNSEKARSNVTKHIKNAIKSIGKAIPSLSTYLKNTLRTGATCCYRPDPNNPIEWTILWYN
jgi:hypothetical protein